MLARKSLLLALLAATAVVAAPAASAATTLSIFDLPAKVENPLKEKDAPSVAFTVNLLADGFNCAQAVNVPIALSLQGTPPAGTTVAVDPAEVSLNIPAGIYNSGAPATPVTFPNYNGSASASVKITVTNVTANQTVQGLKIVATLAQMDFAPPQPCQGSIAAAEAQAPLVFDLQAPTPPPPPEPTPAESPSPALLAALGAIGVAVLVGRRGSRGA